MQADWTHFGSWNHTLWLCWHCKKALAAAVFGRFRRQCFGRDFTQLMEWAQSGKHVSKIDCCARMFKQYCLNMSLIWRAPVCWSYPTVTSRTSWTYRKSPTAVTVFFNVGLHHMCTMFQRGGCMGIDHKPYVQASCVVGCVLDLLVLTTSKAPRCRSCNGWTLRIIGFTVPYPLLGAPCLGWHSVSWQAITSVAAYQPLGITGARWGQRAIDWS